MLLNGPESFTGDGNFILGEAPEVAGGQRPFQVVGHELHELLATECFDSVHPVSVPR
jgi:hypothetical protein